MSRQGKFQDALVLQQQAAKDRGSHDLPQNAAVLQIFESNALENRHHIGVLPPSLRDIY